MRRREPAIVETMEDPNLFLPWFKKPSWEPWKAFLAALFALPLTDEQFTLYKKHTGRTTAPTKQFREARMLCGRRAGKSLIAALTITYLAAFRNYEPYLAPGERATLMCVAADRKQARLILRYTKAFFTDVPLLSPLIARETRETLELTNRVTIEIHTASFRTIRGYTCALAANDEEAFWQSETSAEPASEIEAAERPSLITIPFSILLSLSSPHARRGPMYESVRDHWGKDDSSILVWRGTSLEMNPSLDPAIVKEAYSRDAAAASAEYGAEFRSDVDTFISREVVESCVAPGVVELPRAAGTKYFGFVDPSGGSSDAFTLAIAHSQSVGRPVLDAVREVRPPFSPDAVVQEFATLLRSYGISEVCGDHYAGEWPRERFRVAGITYKTSDLTRSQIYIELLPLLNSRRVVLLDNPRLVLQLAALERRAARSGSETVDHPPGGHDDLCNSAAGALVRANSLSSQSCGGFVSTPRRRIW